MNFKGIVYLAIIGILSSCSTDENNLIADETPRTVVFRSSVIEDQGTQLRAGGNSWASGDSIGVFMKQAGETLSQASVIEGSDNKKYTTTGTGSFLPSSASDYMHYPANGTQVDFIAYYPYQSDINGYIYPIDISDQKSPESIDLLYSDNIKQVDKNSSDEMILGFTHQLTKIRLNVSLQDGSSVPDELQVTISGMNTKASFALDNGVLMIDENSKKDIPLTTASSASGIIAEAIILPQQGMDNRIVKFSSATLGSYTWNISASEKYENGKIYTYYITLNN